MLVWRCVSPDSPSHYGKSMSHSEPPQTEPTYPTPESDATASTPTALFIAWLTRGRLCLVAVLLYLGAVAGVVTALKSLPGVSEGLLVYIWASIIALPLLLIFIFELVPRWDRRQELAYRPRFTPADKGKTPYFQTGPRTNDSYGFFAKGYEHFLVWIRSSTVPLLHLSGPSGSGKSSLIEAYLKPRLESSTPGSKHRVIVVRSQEDPLVALKNDLLILWKKKPDDYDDRTLFQALQRAARQLDAGDRLLVVFDQFEEFFLPRTHLSRAYDRSREANGVAVDDAESEIVALREFFSTFITKPPDRVVLLLAYRDDHACLLEPLRLPPLQLQTNWMRLDPFNFAEAERFLRSCPGLDVPQPRMELALREAARQENGRVLMRPIVANLLGLILQNMAGHPKLWRHKDDLLRGYVREHLGKETREERAAILRALLNDFQTAQPRSVADIATDTHLEQIDAGHHLELLGYAGLVRCVNANEDTGKRVWQISHDFLATLIERVLDGEYRNHWQTARPWVVRFGVVVSAFLIYWSIPPRPAIRELHSMGINIEGTTATFADRQIEQPLFERACELLGSVHSIDEVDLTECVRLTRLDGLERLHGLRSVDASGCTQLRFITALENMDELKSVHFENCDMLGNVDALRGRPALAHVNLGNCDCLLSVAGLRDLPRLELFDFVDCDSLQTLKGFGHLPRLKMLAIWDCSALKTLSGIEELVAMEILTIFRCASLGDLDGLRAMPGLKALHIQSCPSLLTLDDLQSLRNLNKLTVTDCDGLRSVDVLANLPSLEFLMLSNCSSVTDTKAIGQLSGLQSLYLIQCHSLTDVSDLRSLRCLQELDIHGCKSVDAIDALSELTHLEELTIRECSVSETQVKELREKLPDTKVVFEP